MRPGSWGDDLLDFFLPIGCISCGARIRPRKPLVCALCRSRLHVAAWPRCPRCHNPRGTRRAEAPDCLECRSWPSALTAARYAYSLEGPADDLVHALKYEGWTELADFMARAMASPALTQLPDGALGIGPGASGASLGRKDPHGGGIVVPVPTTADRLRRRGYNQAAVLADRLAKLLGTGVTEALLRRPGAHSQTSLAPDARRHNVRDAFRPIVGAEAMVTGARVLLVDDVLTTGATAGEAATTLERMGAQSVTLLTFARALPRRRARAQ